MNDEKLTKVYYSSRFWVTFFWFVCILIILTTGLTGIIHRKEFEYLLKNYWLRLLVEKETPMQIAATIWTIIICLYCGLDRVVDINETLHLPQGQISMGELGKLRVIILQSFTLFMLSFVLDRITNSNFDFQCGTWLTSLGISLITYMSGNKLIKSFKYKNLRDDDSDGIPDQFASEYHKWRRSCLKNHEDKQFITWEYFLDEHPEIIEEIEKLENES